MKPEQLLAHFDRISDTPDAIPRLRRFILDLAVRGRLVDQDPNDERASDLLKRIHTEKARLVKEGKVRSARSFEIGDDKNELFALPPTWTWCRLSEVGAIVGGGTPPSRDLDNFTAGGSGVAWLTPADLGKQGVLYVSHGERDLTPQGLRSSSATLMPQGTVLFTSRAPIGYTAIAANEVSTNQGFKSVVPYIPECNLWIAVYFRAFNKWIDGAASGTTFREVSGKVVANLPFPLPPLAEQRRIVAKVDELMTLCDRLEAAQAERERRRDQVAAASLHRLDQPTNGGDGFGLREHARFHLAHLKRLTMRPDQIPALRQTILDLAVVGRLTVNQQDGGVACEELKDVEIRKRELAIRKSRPIVPVSPEERWCELPRRWVWARWDDITDWITYGFTRPMPHVSEGVPIVTGKNINFGKINWETAHRTTEEAYADLNDKDRPQEGDILLTKDGSIGRSAIVDTEEPFCINQSVAVLWLRSCPFDRRFLQLAIDCPQTQQALLAKTEGVAIKHISVVDFGKMVFPLPPLAEQHRIVSKVDELVALCNRLEAELAAVQTEGRRLLEAVLHEALAPAV